MQSMYPSWRTRPEVGHNRRGRVLHVAPCMEYKDNCKDLKGNCGRCWEQTVQHSIRPDFKDGLILPYHAALEYAATNRDFDPAEIAAFSPEDRLLEFSHASQLVTHDGAIAGLLACAESLNKAKKVLPGNWDRCSEWIDQRLSEIWKARGPCPGLGAALTAFSLEQGTFIARALTENVEKTSTPGRLSTRCLRIQEYLPAELADKVGRTIAETWRKLPAERRSLLKLVSRFELSVEQAKLYVRRTAQKAGLASAGCRYLANPYLLYELTRLSDDPMSMWTVDRGVFPDDVVLEKHPLPSGLAWMRTAPPSHQGATVTVLEEAASSGSTLLPQGQSVLAIRDLALQPPCNVNADLMAVAKVHSRGRWSRCRWRTRRQPCNSPVLRKWVQ